MRLRSVAVPLALAALAGCAAQPAPRAEEGALALRGIMRDMGRELTAATDALLREDYYAVERSASRLAAHVPGRGDSGLAESAEGCTGVDPVG